MRRNKARTGPSDFCFLFLLLSGLSCRHLAIDAGNQVYVSFQYLYHNTTALRLKDMSASHFTWQRQASRKLEHSGCITYFRGVELAASRLLEKVASIGNTIRFEDIIEEVAGVYPKIMTDGEMDAGVWSCGMVAGLIHDIPTCRELIERIMSQAREIIRNRLEGMLSK
jgi:hypothetical protein